MVPTGFLSQVDKTLDKLPYVWEIFFRIKQLLSQHSEVSQDTLLKNILNFVFKQI